MDDLMKLYKKLKNCKKNDICYANKIVCTKKILKEYIGDDRNKLLKLKAELELVHDYSSKKIDRVLLVFAVSTLCVTAIVGITNISLLLYAYVLFVVILSGIYTITSLGLRKIPEKNEWMKYMKIVLDDIETELRGEIKMRK